MVLEIRNFIGGKFVDVNSGNYINSFNPSTGKLHALVPDSDRTDIDEAVEKAESAFVSWSKSTPMYRSQIMMKIADILESKIDEFAKLEAEDQGKPFSLAKSVDIPRAVYNFRFFATAIIHNTDICTTLHDLPVASGNALNYVQAMAVGVAGLICPWNLPLYLLTWKIAPAIAFGNTCVAKPSEVTSVTAWKLCEVLQEAGLPPGVVNVVFGYGYVVGEALVSHPKVPLISFTGSTVVGKHIIKTAASYCKKLSLELGGKNAAIVFEDTDLSKHLQTLIKSGFANQGEICLCTSRIFVHENIFDDFLMRYVKLVQSLKLGPVHEPSTTTGALVSKEHKDKVMKYITTAKTSGATIHCGEFVDEVVLPKSCENGYFVQPTVITGLDDTNPCMKDEIFGPVVCITPFKSELEVIKRVNDVDYGLCASVYTQNIEKAHRVASKLQVGTVWVNSWLIRDLHMPFGGVKLSGVGRESLFESKKFFTEAKTICVPY